MDLTPHDEFIRRALGRPEAAADLLRVALPSEILRHLDLKHIDVSSRTFVDDDLRRQHSDLLFQVPTTERKAAFVYVLIEHKSEPYHWVMLQLYRYLGQVWRSLVEQAPGSRRLPAVIPLVVYHGKRSWRVPLYFQNLLELHSGVDAALQPQFRAIFCNLGTLNAAEAPVGRRFLTTVLALQLVRRYGPALLRRLIRELAQVPMDGAWREVVQATMAYLLRGLEPYHRPKILGEIERQQFREGREQYMTIADSLIQQGIAQGALREKQQVLARQVERKFDITDQERELIEGTTDAGALDRALDAVITADSKKAVLEELR
jgi:predicted transposase YdaD